MKNPNVLLALFLFSYLQICLDTSVLRHPNSNTAIKQSMEVVKEFLGCCLSCMSADDDLSVHDQSSNVLEALQLVCTQMGCVPAPVSSPSLPANQEPMPAIFKEVIPQFEAPGMLNGLIIET